MPMHLGNPHIETLPTRTLKVIQLPVLLFHDLYKGMYTCKIHAPLTTFKHVGAIHDSIKGTKFVETSLQRRLMFEINIINMSQHVHQRDELETSLGQCCKML